MWRLYITRLHSLGRRNLSHSPELRRWIANSFNGQPAADIWPFSSSSNPVSIGRSGHPRRCLSSISERDESSIEEDVERKMGWLLKLIFVGTASMVAYQFFPYMGDNLLQQSISLLQVKDPLFKRMGASRLSRFAIDDVRRMKVIEMGGAQELLSMLESAKDDKTRKEALKTLLALSYSDEAAEVLQHAGAISIVASTPDSIELVEVGMYKSSLLKRLRGRKHDITPLDGELV